MKNRILVAFILLAMFPLFSCDGHITYVKNAPKTQEEIDAELMKKYPIHDIGNHYQFEFSSDDTGLTLSNVNVRDVVRLYARHGYKVVCAVPYSSNGSVYIIFEWGR